MVDRWFTPESARHALVRLRPAAERMCRLYEILARHTPRPVVTEQPVDRRYFLLVRRLHRVVDEIRRSGVQVRDLREGLLGFPARRDGRIVHLYWRVGDSTDDDRWDDA